MYTIRNIQSFEDSKLTKQEFLDRHNDQVEAGDLSKEYLQKRYQWMTDKLSYNEVTAAYNKHKNIINHHNGAPEGDEQQ